MRKFALLLLVAPLALAACGSASTAHVTADPVAYVKRAAAKTAALKSEHIVMVGVITEPAGQSILLTGNGDFANSPFMGSFAGVISGASQDFPVKEVFAGKTVYLRAPGLMNHRAPGKTWAKIDSRQLRNATHLSLFSQNPAEFLGQLSAAGSVTSLGAKTIDGVETTHYRVANLDLSKIPPGTMLGAFATSPEAKRARGKLTIGPINVWVGKTNGYVYRETVSVSAAAPAHGSWGMRVDFSKFNEPVRVAVPPASETADMSSLGE